MTPTAWEADCTKSWPEHRAFLDQVRQTCADQSIRLFPPTPRRKSYLYLSTGGQDYLPVATEIDRILRERDDRAAWQPCACEPSHANATDERSGFNGKWMRRNSAVPSRIVRLDSDIRERHAQIAHAPAAKIGKVPYRTQTPLLDLSATDLLCFEWDCQLE